MKIISAVLLFCLTPAFAAGPKPALPEFAAPSRQARPEEAARAGQLAQDAMTGGRSIGGGAVAAAPDVAGVEGKGLPALPAAAPVQAPARAEPPPPAPVEEKPMGWLEGALVIAFVVGSLTVTVLGMDSALRQLVVMEQQARQLQLEDDR